MIIRKGEGAMDNNYLFNKKSDFINISEEQKMKILIRYLK